MLPSSEVKSNIFQPKERQAFHDGNLGPPSYLSHLTLFISRDIEKTEEIHTVCSGAGLQLITHSRSSLHGDYFDIRWEETMADIFVVPAQPWARLFSTIVTERVFSERFANLRPIAAHPAKLADTCDPVSPVHPKVS